MLVGAATSTSRSSTCSTCSSDVPAGKLAIADLGGVTQAQIDELERAGVDAVLVRELL